MNLRGQAATEYLIILAVVVIIALIVVGVLGAFPALSGGVTKQQSEAYWLNAEIGVLPNYRFSGNTANLTIKNNKGFTIRVTGIEFDGRGRMSPRSVLLAPGTQADIGVTGLSRCNAGEQIGYTVSIDYEDSASGRDFTFTGTTQLVGTCQ
ncbi:hypothetical protein DRN67_01280 [Candidatus Micrarchaeota archaeon]|nr:MAG: hypothetical protein DRN67_01280 [Candidatus Micrarchaeota archaeon]